MSVQALTSVFRNSRLAGTSRLVMLAIANYCGDEGAWPSIDSIAADCRMSRRAVQECIRRSEAAGELHVELNAGPRGANRYWLHIEEGGCRFCTRADPRNPQGSDQDKREPGIRKSALPQMRDADFRRKSAPEPKEHTEYSESSIELSSYSARKRARDAIYEILFVVETGEPYSAAARRRLTRKAADALNAAVAEIRETGVSADELRRAIAAWPQVMGAATCTAHAVAKHLPRLLAAARGVVLRRDPDSVDAVAARVAAQMAAEGA